MKKTDIAVGSEYLADLGYPNPRAKVRVRITGEQEPATGAGNKQELRWPAVVVEVVNRPAGLSETLRLPAGQALHLHSREVLERWEDAEPGIRAVAQRRDALDAKAKDCEAALDRIGLSGRTRVLGGRVQVEVDAEVFLPWAATR